MSRRWKHARWQPDAAWAETLPGASGNVINGRGERTRRRAQQIFWFRAPADEPYAQVQRVVTRRFTAIPALDTVYRNADRGPRRLPPPTGLAQAEDPASCTARIKRFVLGTAGTRPPNYPTRAACAEMVGIAALDPDWLFAGYTSGLPSVVIIGTVMDHARLAQLPGNQEQLEGQLEVAEQYNRGARVANYLARWLREQGWSAQPHTGPWCGALNLVPAAIAAGFGELGAHGSLIHPVYGSSFRLSAVETDAPLVHDTPLRFGADEFCTRCRVCADRCPPQAIGRGKEWVRGDYKWYVDFDRCLPYFNETYGCGICLAVCPWSTPGRAPKLAAVWRKRIGNGKQAPDAGP